MGALKFCRRLAMSGDAVSLFTARYAGYCLNINFYFIFFLPFTFVTLQVVEFAEYGNLSESWPHHNIEHLWRYTIQAATALEYLEKRNVIHLAVFSYNFLVVAGFKVVIIIVVIIIIINIDTTNLALPSSLCRKWDQLAVQSRKRPSCSCSKLA